MVENAIIIGIILFVTGLAIRYIRKEKKEGAHCVGCPSAGCCPHKGCCRTSRKGEDSDIRGVIGEP